MIFKKAFTMIELIFVIVVMGILAKFGFSFLAQSYTTFIYSKINNELQAKSNQAIDFITKRLEYSIKQSVIKRINSTSGFKGAAEPASNEDDYNILEWIAYDNDGFRGNSQPLWSGIIDLDPTLTSASKLTSPETNTTAVNNFIKALSDNNSTITNSALFFKGANYSPKMFGWAGSDSITDQSKALKPITKTNANINAFVSSISGKDFTNQRISNIYKLTWTANAIVLDSNTHKLWFYYNYQPWNGDAYSMNKAKKRLLMEDVSTFRIHANSSGRFFTIAICVKSNLTNEEHSLCKEKVIF